MKMYLPASAAFRIAAMPLPDPSVEGPVCSFVLPTSTLVGEAVLLPQPVTAIVTRLLATSAKPTLPRVDRLTEWFSFNFTNKDSASQLATQRSQHGKCAEPYHIRQGIYMVTNIRLNRYSNFSHFAFFSCCGGMPPISHWREDRKSHRACVEMAK